MRKLVDEIMGPERNKLPDQSGDFGVKFHDEQVRRWRVAVPTAAGVQILPRRLLPLHAVPEHKV